MGYHHHLGIMSLPLYYLVTTRFNFGHYLHCTFWPSGHTNLTIFSPLLGSAFLSLLATLLRARSTALALHQQIHLLSVWYHHSIGIISLPLYYLVTTRSCFGHHSHCMFWPSGHPYFDHFWSPFLDPIFHPKGFSTPGQIHLSSLSPVDPFTVHLVPEPFIHHVSTIILPCNHHISFWLLLTLHTLTIRSP